MEPSTRRWYFPRKRNVDWFLAEVTDDGARRKTSDSGLILKLFRWNKHNPTVSPLRNGIARALVIADGFFYSPSCSLNYPVLKLFVRDRLCLQLSFCPGLFAHIAPATRSIGQH